MATLSAPRLMPATIAAMAALLAIKSVTLVKAALPVATPQNTVVASAQAASGREATTPRAQAPQPPAPQPAEAQPQPISDAERAVLLELRRRRQELDTREVALGARESVLAAAEQRLNARVQELLGLQSKLEALEASRKEREELGWKGLVKVYEVMKPRDAAAIFNDLQMPVLLPVLDRMKEAKAAPVLAAMNPDKAREVTAALAKLRSDRNGGVAPPGG